MVVALFQYVLTQSLDAVVRAAPWYAAVGVLHEGALKEFVGVVIVKVVHHAVAELCGKDLALLGAFHDEYRRGLWLVRAAE